MLTSDSMDEKAFLDLADQAMSRVLRALDKMDPDVVEAALEAGVVKIAFPQGPPFILNTQRPVREMWLAAGSRAWHFKYDGAQWIDGKSGDELFTALSAVIAKRAGVPVIL